MPSEPPSSLFGRYSPLRYPGGKGKLARFVQEIVRLNGLSDGRYVEPYAGGAAIAWELLITGVARRVSINDISRPVFAFWHSVLNNTDSLCRRILETPITIEEWDHQKNIFRNYDCFDNLDLGFSFFFLNRTNRSGILNGGAIGGRQQKGEWKIDARFNRQDLVRRIEKIASLQSRVELTQMDAVDFIAKSVRRFGRRTLFYVDPPYFEKGRFLYHDAYQEGDHAVVADGIKSLRDVSWIVSYDDVRPIHDLYARSSWMQYTLNYSARTAGKGREVMFFSPGLIVPSVVRPMEEIARDLRKRPTPVSQRSFG